MPQPPYVQKIIPCECGSTDAYWHGDTLRFYGCLTCWKRKGLCSYCDKPTRKGSLVLDEGQTAHRSCYKEFER